MYRFLLVAISLYVMAWLVVDRAYAVPVTGFVDGRSNLYKASPSGGGDGLNPLSIHFKRGIGGELTFSSVTGGTHCCSGDPSGGGSSTADGIGGLPTTNIFESGGISGLLAPGTMFLSGVFVDSTAGFGLAPAKLDYFSDLSTSDPIFSPVLNQAFFIGDGLTSNGSGSIQTFQVPDFADRLFLGFVDGNGFSGSPNFFNDNTGGLNVVGSLQNVSPVPLPAGFWLLLGALACAFGTVRLRNRPGAAVAT